VGQGRALPQPEYKVSYFAQHIRFIGQKQVVPGARHIDEPCAGNAALQISLPSFPVNRRSGVEGLDRLSFFSIFRLIFLCRISQKGQHGHADFGVVALLSSSKDRVKNASWSFVLAFGPVGIGFVHVVQLGFGKNSLTRADLPRAIAAECS
jgi:hypothetical protein